MNARPAGNTSRTRTFVASPGPLFVAAMVNVTVSPTVGAALSTDLVICRFAEAPPIVTPAWLFSGTGSSSPCAVFVAMFVMTSVVSTVATSTSWAAALSARPPTCQTPVIGS